MVLFFCCLAVKTSNTGSPCLKLLKAWDLPRASLLTETAGQQHFLNLTLPKLHLAKRKLPGVIELHDHNSADFVLFSKTLTCTKYPKSEKSIFVTGNGSNFC